MKISKVILFSACLISLVGCLDNNTGTGPITEPVVKSEYYITNQSDSDLNATYKIDSYVPRDSTVTVPADSTAKIFESAGIGGDTFPSVIFTRLSFYLKSEDTTDPLLTIEPIVNDDWNRTAGEISNVTKFELVITNEDLN